MSSLAVTVYIVLIVGNASGAVVKGITGFGSAIINLCVWVISTSAGVNSGPLQLAVVTECICSEVLAIPLVILTRAHQTADARLVLAIFIFTTLGAPIGAWLLMGLNPRVVELVVAIVLALVVFLHCKLHLQAAQLLQWLVSKYTGFSKGYSFKNPYKRLRLDTDDVISADEPTAADQGNDWSKTSIIKVQLAEQQCCITGEEGCHDDLKISTAKDEAPGYSEAAITITCSSRSASALQSSTQIAAAAASHEHHPRGDSSLTLNNQCPELQCLSPEDTSIAAAALQLQSYAAASPRQAANHSDQQDQHTEQCTLLQHQQHSSQAPDSCTSSSAAGLLHRFRHWLASTWQQVRLQWTDPDKRREMLRITGYGSLAGTAGGIMAGMTGMGGPPIMFLYEKLKVPKDTVRGTNAMLNIMQSRIIFYITLGVFQASEAPLYILCVAGSAVGTLAGNALAARMDQATFSRVLVALMLICCALMFASAAGSGK